MPRAMRTRAAQSRTACDREHVAANGAADEPRECDFHHHGPPEQAKTLLIEALETADALNDLNAQAGALSMLISIYFARGEFGRAQIAAERIEQVAHRIGDPVHLRFAYQQMANTLLTRGRSREAQQYLERLLRSPAASGDPRDAIYYNSNDHAADRATLAQALWMQGFAEQAVNEARLCLKELQGG